MKRLLIILPVFLASLLSFSILNVHPVSADTFNQNDVIDDGVFDNVGTLNAAQIDSWLNANFGSTSCISTQHGFSAPDPTGYNPTQGFLYGGNVSAGQVIYDAAQAYGINPEVLLTTLQKEQSLVSGTAGCSTLRYAAATGYGCPDGGTTYSYSGVNLYSINGVAVTSVSGTCVNTSLKVGFSQQVIRAAWLLKFGEQRSEGNVSWAVIKGNWNNSDDPQSCYGGPMTQGTWARCPSGGSAYYDGYTTIDGTSVHMDTGSTAALYWYTPHFAGNQNFFNIFTGWFGSTQFPQPLGGALYYQLSTGKIYLATDSVRYYVPDWDTMTNYGLDRYPYITADDTTIQQFSDGGNLTNLIWDSNGVYLVNNGYRYHVSSSMCTAWGFSCSDNSVVKSLGATFQTQYLQQGGELTQLMASNGVIYEAVNGQKDPIANPQTLQDLSLSNTGYIVGSNFNANSLPLGPLLMTTAGVVNFAPNPTVYYYDGTSYYAVDSMDSYNDWGFGNITHISVPTSSYNTSPPSYTMLTPWYKDTGGNEYIVDQGRKVLIPTDMTSTWQSVTFSTQSSTLASKLPQATLTKNVYTDGVYQLYNGQQHHVPNWANYLALGISNATTTNLRPNKLQSVPVGNDALGDGALLTLQGDTQKIYVINNGKTTWVPNPDIYNAYGFSWSGILSYPTTILNDYPQAASPLSNGTVNGNYYVSDTGKMYQVTSSTAGNFGVVSSQFQSISPLLIANARPAALSRFMYNRDTGKIYYASGGAIHYVATYSAFVAYGGTRSAISTITNADLPLFTEAQAVY